jgi:hypothetical protein
VDFDDIVIGSGLSALGAVLGLPRGRRVLVLGGGAGFTQYYHASGAVPCAHVGFGGLGNFWHGVIPFGLHENYASSREADFVTLFEHFYPGIRAVTELGRPCVFVPWRPIRPATQWPRLAAVHAGRLVLRNELVTRFAVGDSAVTVHTEGARFRTERVWVCSGALQTPQLLSRSLGRELARPTVSDHVLCYVGQIDRAVQTEVSPAVVRRTRHGMWLECRYDAAARGLYSLRPARFAFSQLDSGIERRAVFGLPTGTAVAKILRSASAGLLAEALFNRAGCFPCARMQSIYVQLAVPDAYWFRGGDLPLDARLDVIHRATEAARDSVPWPGVIPSRRRELFIPVIHLHHSVDRRVLAELGVNLPGSRVQVLDASVYDEIGPDHHSFKLMVAAFARAKESQ